VTPVRLGFVGAGLLVACCGGPQTITAPPPEYERPVVRPWDAGRAEDPEDPFALAAEGDWIEEPLPPVEAGVPTDGAAAAETGAVVPAEASLDAGSEAVTPAGSAAADGGAAGAGGNP